MGRFKEGGSKGGSVVEGGGDVRVRAGTTTGGIVVGLGLEGGEECGEAVFSYGFPWLDGSHVWGSRLKVHSSLWTGEHLCLNARIRYMDLIVLGLEGRILLENQARV